MDGSVCVSLGELRMGGRPSLWLLERMLVVGDLTSTLMGSGVRPCSRPCSRGEWRLPGL